METHAHHLHKAPGKSFGHYFFEFLMLFLAVFCGFLAENIREHYVDMRKEKEYMHSLLQDLHADVREMDTTLKVGTMSTEKLDSLIYMLNEKDPDENAQTIYRLAPGAGRVVGMSFSDRTSSQLKNSGSMRLVRNSNLSDSIEYYWEEIKNDDFISDRLLDLQSKATDLTVQVINNKYYESPDASKPLERSLKPGAKLITSDPKLIAQLSNRESNRRVVLYNYLRHLRITHEMAVRLIELIKKEYHFE